MFAHSHRITEEVIYVSEDWSIRPRSVVGLPTPEEAAAERRGVVFYRIDVSTFPQAEAIAAVVGIYRLVTKTGPGRRTQEGTYEMRVGLRLKPDDEGRYWVGFNHPAFGAMFEQALRATGQRPFRTNRLRGGDPNQELPLVDVDALEARRAQLMGGGKKPARKAAPASPFAALIAPPEPTGPVEQRDSKAIMRDARGQLFSGLRARRRKNRKGDQQDGDVQQ